MKDTCTSKQGANLDNLFLGSFYRQDATSPGPHLLRISLNSSYLCQEHTPGELTSLLSAGWRKHLYSHQWLRGTSGAGAFTLATQLIINKFSSQGRRLKCQSPEFLFQGLDCRSRSSEPLSFLHPPKRLHRWCWC